MKSEDVTSFFSSIEWDSDKPRFVEPELNSWFPLLLVFTLGLRAKPAPGASVAKKSWFS